MLLAIGGTAVADDISNSLDNTVDVAVEVMNLAPGGATGTTTFHVIPQNGDGKNGCNFQGTTTSLVLAVASSNPAAASVSPSNLTFASCGDTKTVTVTSGAAGTARISLTQTSNSTTGTFNLAPATFDVVVAAVKTATTTSLSCPASVVYTGAAQSPCSATTTGQNGFTATATLSYSANTNAGTASVTATYAGDATHLGSSDTQTFAITRAASSTTITCTDQTYTGAALEPCGARATGVGGLDVEVTPTYTNNTDAGIADVSALYEGDANHNGSAASQTFRIDQAAATCTVTGFDGVYDGAAHGLSGSCTGVGGADLTSGLSLGGSHTSAGSHSVDWAFDGGTNHADQAGTAIVTIARAQSTVEVTCPATKVYTAEEQTPCTATVTGPGGLDESAPVTYLANENAGTATAIGNYAGGPNHEASTGTGTFEITKAATTTTVTCSAGPHVYTGSAVTPCSATVTGPGLSQSLTPTYSTNQDAGSAGASAAFAGTENHWASSGSSAFTITKAPSVVTVDCPASVVYTGSAHEPCEASVTGAGGLDERLTVGYADNTNAGAATASASYAGSPNHEPDSASAEFTIAKAPSTVDVTCPTSEVYTGDPIEPCSASVTGAGGLHTTGLEVTYTDNENVGTATASSTYGGDDNHTGDSGSGEFEITQASSTTKVTCLDGPFVYTGDPISPCAASVTGVGGLSESLSVHYSGNVEAGPVTASASYPGGVNHAGSVDSETFVIGQADATCVVTGYDGVYDADAHGLTGTCTGVGDADLSDRLDLGGTYTEAGSYEVSWSFDGGRNYADQSATTTIEITKAPSTVVVTCDDGPFVYSGAAHSPCTATVTGVGGLDEEVEVDYANTNTGAGTATATATYGGGANHEADTGSETFVIEKAPSSITLICDGAKTYTGHPVTPCSATASGVDVGPIVLTVDYTDNVDAGPVTATAVWAGDDNHLGSEETADFTITQATSTVTVTCPESVVYSGAALTPCSARATGAGGLDLSALVTYTDNTDAGTAHASASFGGDANHTGNTGATTFVISKAPSSVTIVCDGAKTFTGSALQPCTATASGAGMADIERPVSYLDNVNAGTATANAGWDGDDNHTGSTGSTTFAIAKAPSSVTVTCPTAPVYFTGYALTPDCSARASGAGGLDVPVTPVTFTNNTAVGTATASATFAGGPNHLGSTGQETFQILAWTTNGFFKPVDMGTTAIVWNTVKNGSTVPLKFRLFSGSSELTSTTAVQSFKAVTVSCVSAAEDAIEELATTGGTSLRYDTTGTQFIQNWQTPKKAGACYKVTMTALDGSTIAAHFKLK